MASRYSLLPSCTTAVSTMMLKLGARAPQTRYLGRSISAGLYGEVDAGVVRTLCSFLTDSGCERELEVPVIIYQGEILEPTMTIVGGNPVILTESLVSEISKAGSVYDKPHLGTMYSTAYDIRSYRETRDSLEYQPRIFRSVF